MNTAPATRTRLALGVLLAAYAVFLAWHIGAVAGGSDNSGYFNEARLFSRLSIHAPARALEGLPAADAPPYLYVPLGLKPSPSGPARLVPTYPPGLPLLLVPAAAVAGWDHAGDLTLILHALAGLALTFALGRRCGLSVPWAAAGAAVLGLSPVYIFTSLQALSDVPATVWAAAAVLAAAKSRERAPWALAAGLAFSVAFLVRPSNFLVALPMAIVLGLSPRRLALAAAGALPGILTWLGLNHVAYGSALQSGYGAIGNEFHADLIRMTLRFCARWIPFLFGPVVILAPAVAFLYRRQPRWVAALVAWVAAFVAFYSAYRWTHEDWWFLRFLLPAAPAFIVASLVVIQACLDRLRRALPPSVLLTAAVLIVGSTLGAEATQVSLLDAWRIGHGELKYGRATRWMNANLPKDGVVVASQFSGAVFYFTEFALLRGDEIDPPTSARIRASLGASHRPLYAVVFPFERNLLARLPCRWTVVRSVDDVLVLRGDWPTK